MLAIIDTTVLIFNWISRFFCIQESSPLSSDFYKLSQLLCPEDADVLEPPEGI